jgi:hypothetical protein
MSSHRFSAHERDYFASLMSLFHTLCVRQFCSPLGGFFWFVPGFVEGDQVVPGFQCVWVSVTEFQTPAFDGFD